MTKKLSQRDTLYLLCIIILAIPYYATCQINTCSPYITGTAPVDGDCQSYVECLNGLQLGGIRRCASINGEQTFYDYVEGNCKVGIQQTRCYPGSTITCLPSSSPFYEDYIPHPVNCERLQMCIGNPTSPTQTSCPGGTLFDIVQQRCRNDPVKCYPGSFRNIPPPEPTTTFAPVTTSRPSIPSTTADPNSRCSPGSTSLIPHETDCKKYFLCDIDGIAIPRECREGLLFDILERTCLNEDMALCYITATTSATSTTFRTTEFITSSSTTTRPVVECPSVGNINMTHPRNCCFYYNCINGQLSVERCWDRDSFDSVDLMCKPKNIAKCVTGSVKCMSQKLQIGTNFVIVLILISWFIT